MAKKDDKDKPKIPQQRGKKDAPDNKDANKPPSKPKPAPPIPHQTTRWDADDDLKGKEPKGYEDPHDKGDEDKDKK